MNINGTDLFKIREVYRLSGAEMAALVEVSEALIYFIEQGKRVLTERTKQRLIDALELSPDKLKKILSIYDEYKIK